jgi:hypothetical protein
MKGGKKMEMVRVFAEGPERIAQAVASVEGDIVKLLSWEDEEIERTEPGDIVYALLFLSVRAGNLIHDYVKRDGESLEQKLDRLKDLKFPFEALRKKIPPSDPAGVIVLSRIQKMIHLLPGYIRLVDAVNRVPRSVEEKSCLFMKVAEGAGSYKDITLLLLASSVIESSWCTHILSHMKITDIKRTIELASLSRRISTPSRSLSVVGQCPLLPEILEIALKAVNMEDEGIRNEILLGCICTLGFRWLPEFLRVFPEREKVRVVRYSSSWDYLTGAILAYKSFLLGEISPSRTLGEMAYFFKWWVNVDPFGASKSILSAIRREKEISEGFGILFSFTCHPEEKEDAERRLERVMQSLSSLPEFNL